MKTSYRQALFTLIILVLTGTGCLSTSEKTVAEGSQKLTLAYIEGVDLKPASNRLNIQLRGIKIDGCEKIDHLTETIEGRHISISTFVSPNRIGEECTGKAGSFNLPYLIDGLEPGKYKVTVKSSGENIEQETVIATAAPSAG